MGYSSKDDSIIDGFRVLYEQAYYQYKLWYPEDNINMKEYQNAMSEYLH